MNVGPLGLVEFGARRKARDEIELFLRTEGGVAVCGEKIVRYFEGDFGFRSPTPCPSSAIECSLA